jgi:amino acid transporter
MKNPPGGGSLVRLLGRRDVLALAFGAMIGWSWVVLTGTWITSAGSLGAIVAFVAGGIAIVTIGLTYAELAAALPFVGGEHVYSERALGRGASFVCTWAIILGYASVVAFEAVALPTVAGSLLPGLDTGYLWTVAGWDVYFTWAMVGVCGAIVMTLTNILGIKAASILQSAVVAIILVVGTGFVGGAALRGEAANLQPLFEDGLSGITLVLVMVPFMFVGFDVIPQVAEEIKLPFRDIGTVLIVAVVMAVLWYALIIFGVAYVLDREALAHADPATSAAGGVVFGAWGARLVLLAGLAGILTSWNAFLVGGSRAVYALAQAGLLPAYLGRLHPRFNTPHHAVLLIGALSMLAPFFGRKALVWLVDAGGLGIVIAYAMVAASFLVLRRREPSLARPYRVPAGMLVGTLALACSVGLGVLYLPGSPAALAWPEEWAIVIGWSLLGALLYALARRSATAARHNPR